MVIFIDSHLTDRLRGFKQSVTDLAIPLPGRCLSETVKQVHSMFSVCGIVL